MTDGPGGPNPYEHPPMPSPPPAAGGLSAPAPGTPAPDPGRPPSFVNPPDDYRPPSPFGTDPASAPPAPPAKKSGSIVVRVVVPLVAAAAGFFVANQFLFADRDAPTAEDVQAAFTPLSGYEYQDVPPEVRSELDRQLASIEDFDEEVHHYDARMLARAQQLVGVVLVLSYDPDELNQQAFLAGFSAASGAEPVEFQLAGGDAHFVDAGGFGSVVFFDEDGLVFTIVGQDRSLLEQVGSSLRTANE